MWYTLSEWRFARVWKTFPTADWFDDLVVNALFVPINGAIGLGEYFLGDQVLEHIAKYALHTSPSTPGGQRKRLILAGHSQGSEMVVLERRRLSLADQADTFTIAVSALGVPEPEADKYTTLDKDNLATVIFAQLGAPLANVALASAASCSDLGSSPWHCHALAGVYFTLPETRGKVANDIVSLLPTQGGSCDSDTTPPSRPTGLTATIISSNQINLSWNPSVDTLNTSGCSSGVDGYTISRDDDEIVGCFRFDPPGTCHYNATIYSDAGLSPGTTHSYTISAYDRAGNTSAQSLPVSAATLP